MGYFLDGHDISQYRVANMTMTSFFDEQESSRRAEILTHFYIL